MTVDPGMPCGWAIWEGGALEPIDWGESRAVRLASGRKRDYVDRIPEVLKSVRAAIMVRDVKHVYCEEPAFFQTAGGEMVAASGDLVKLSMFVGAVAIIASQLNAKFELVEIRSWKGQLGKAQTKHRVTKIMGEPFMDRVAASKASTHIVDAIGIGLYLQGRF